MLDDASTKIRSAHVDRLYVRRPHPFRRARWITTFACFAIALIWSIVYGLPTKSRVHDPGPLSSAHRQWQSDCRRCHDGGSGGGGGGDPGGMLKSVSLAVSDSACLQCHDGAIHTAAQSHFASADKSRSANCVACHIEHKGGDALAANQDQTCVQCHGNLTSELAGAKSSVTNRIVAFDVGDKHPTFGRSFEQRDGKPLDPTVLKFNHAKHMTLGEIQSNCVLCHEPRDPSPGAKPQAAKSAPPWKSAKDRSMDAIGSSDGRYMHPVSYERHCQSCHELKLPASEVQIAHEAMSLVRAQVQSFSAADLRGIAEAKAAEKPRPGQRPSKPKSLNEQAIEKVRTAVNAEMLQKLNEALANPAAPATTQPTKPDANLVELYVAFAAGTSCAYCHQMQGDVPALSKSNDTLLASVPTQIPDAPRRWFAASQFDHRAHRGMSCISCHAAAVTSTETSQLLQPNIETCVACHRSDEHNHVLADTAPSNCITCHQFHDRRLETWGNGKNAMSAAR